MPLIWKLFHLITAFALIAGLIARNITFRLAQRATALPALAALLSASLALERWLVIPGSMLVLASGGLSAWLGHWAFLSSSGQPTWLLGALIVYLSLIPLIGAVLAPRRAKREQALTTAVAANQITPELTATLNDRAVRWLASTRRWLFSSCWCHGSEAVLTSQPERRRTRWRDPARAAAYRGR